MKSQGLEAHNYAELTFRIGNQFKEIKKANLNKTLTKGNKYLNEWSAFVKYVKSMDDDLACLTFD